jgi:hypothetical protein
MLLPFDPLLTLRLGDRRLYARLGTVLVVGIACVGAVVVEGGGAAGWIGGVATALAVGGAFLVHLSAQDWACDRVGTPVRRAHLAVFGGVPDTLDDAGTPRAEALVGLAGLGAVVALAAVAALCDLLTRDAAAAVRDPVHAAAVALAGIAVVQAMPALPLDGGRLFRGLVWYLTDSPVAGARAAALYAHLVAAGLIVFGAIAFAFDGALPYWGLWAVIAGWQLGGEARAGVSRLRWQRLARATPLGDVTLPALSLPAARTIEEALDPLIAAGGDAPFLVDDADGRPAGVLRLANLRGCPRAEWDRRPVAEVMTSLGALPRLDVDRSCFDALVLLDDLEGGRAALPGAPVVLVERDGVPVAALDRRQVRVRLLTLGRRQVAASEDPGPSVR